MSRYAIHESGEPLPSFKTREGIMEWIGSVDHKQIGIMYLLLASFFFILGGLEALFMRLQLAQPELEILGPVTYNQFFTMHGTTMIFLVLTPGLIGLSAYSMPLMIGANDLVFPRLNAFSLWITLFGGLLLYFSYFAGGLPNAGWFSYAPLSEVNFSSTPGVSYYSLSLLLTGVGTMSAALNLMVTIIMYRAPGMGLRDLPLFVWTVFINSFLILGAFPPLNAGLSMLLIDRLLEGYFFLPEFGGSAMLWQHVFWAFGHPEVYILILPAFGIISEVIPVFSRKPIFGYTFVAASTVAIALLSFGVWAHHMFTTGMGNTVNSFFSAASILIGVPTGIKVFNWIGTMVGGKLHFKTAMLFCIAFILDFTLGGLSGIAFAMVPIDWMLTDSYFVVAHLHYVFLGGTIFAAFAGIYYWFPKMTGRMLSEKLGQWHFWLFLIGFNLTFFVQHFLGMMGMPRRVYTYPDLPWFGTLNLMATIGAFVMGIAILILAWNIWISLNKKPDAGEDPWDAWTLEWATTSPPQPKNFTKIPPIKSRRPLWDLKHPDNPDWKKQEES